MCKPAFRPLLGAALVILIVGVFAFSISLFRGGFGATSTITIVSERAGLVMNPDAKVRWHGVQVGQVQSIETRPDGRAVLHLAMDPSQLSTIPDNVAVAIASSTVFGAKFVRTARCVRTATAAG